MPDKKPIKATYSGTDTNGLAEFIDTDTIAIADGGTGATTAGAALTALGASPLAGSSSITTLGTIGTGVWGATDVAVAHGGTGASDASTARSNLGITDTTPGGSPTQIQYNNSGAFGGSANLTFNGTTLNVVGNAGVGIARTDGTLHVHTATAGSVAPNANEDDLVIENSTHCGITILAPDASDSTLCFGSASDAVGAVLRWNHDANLLKLSTANAGDSITFGTAADVLAMTINASQQVGIGTAVPTAKLNVYKSGGGTADVVTNIAGSTSTGTFTNSFGNTSNRATAVISTAYTSGEGILNCESAGNSRLFVSAAGRVDIGTTGATVSSSADGLVVNDGANAGMTIYSTGTSSGQMKLSLTNAEGADAGAAMIYNNSADALFFNVNGATERMRISSTGNVNIGTAHTGAGMFEVNNPTNSGWISGKATHGDVTGNSLQMWFVSSTAADGDVPLQFNAAYGSGGTQVGAIDCTVDDITGGTIDSHWNHRSYQNSSARIATLSSAGVWTDYSAGADKEFLGTRQEVWPSGILPAICGLNVSKYQPANQPEGKPVREYHISPTAEDLYDAFGVGEDPHTKKLNKDGENITHPGIAPKDLAGIALVGLQELCGLVEAQAARITALESA